MRNDNDAEAGTTSGNPAVTAPCFRCGSPNGTLQYLVACGAGSVWKPYGGEDSASRTREDDAILWTATLCRGCIHQVGKEFLIEEVQESWPVAVFSLVVAIGFGVFLAIRCRSADPLGFMVNDYDGPRMEKVNRGLGGIWTFLLWPAATVTAVVGSLRLTRAALEYVRLKKKGRTTERTVRGAFRKAAEERLRALLEVEKDVLRLASRSSGPELPSSDSATCPAYAVEHRYVGQVLRIVGTGQTPDKALPKDWKTVWQNRGSRTDRLQ